jgi:hypothetical protein
MTNVSWQRHGAGTRQVGPKLTIPFGVATMQTTAARRASAGAFSPT